MKPLKLHLKTALLASAVALVALTGALLLISARVANQFRNEQKQLAQLQAENLAEHLSLFPNQFDNDDLKQLSNLVSGSRPNIVTVRIWRLDAGNFVEQTAADDSAPDAAIPPETENALRTGAASQTVNRAVNAENDAAFRVFAPILIGGRVDGAVEIVERLDTISSIALGYLINLSWIAVATILLMTAAFYLLFQSLVYRPLAKMLAAMDAAKAGDLSVSVAGRNKIDEFGRLSANFNQMIGQIREMTGEREKQTEILHDKITEATVELQTKNEQLEVANRELFRTTRQMSEMERLAATIQTAAQFAHEVGTPLNLISGHTQLLEAHLPENSKEAERLKIIKTQIARIENIVREMLDRTRFAATAHAPVNLNEILKLIGDAVEPTLHESRVAMIVDLHSHLPTVNGDAGRLQQVFFNLVKNALDAMPDGGTLSISTADEGDQVRVEFKDDGGGMTNEVAAQIFQPLFTTKERGRGTGLGLVVVKQIMDDHRAAVEIESAPSAGTTVRLIFPAAHA